MRQVVSQAAAGRSDGLERNWTRQMSLTLMALLLAYVADWLRAIWRAFPPPPR